MYGCFSLLRHVAARDPVILQAQMLSLSVRVEIRLQIFKRKVPADIAVKLAVNVISRISDLRAPYLLACLNVACKNGRSVRTYDRCVHAVFRPRIAVKYRVRIAYKILDAGVFQKIFDPGFVRGFGQPDSARLPAKVLFVIRNRDLDLRPACLRCRYQRQKPMRCAASDDLDNAFFLKLAKSVDKISTVTVVPKIERRANVSTYIRAAATNAGASFCVRSSSLSASSSSFSRCRV